MPLFQRFAGAGRTIWAALAAIDEAMAADPLHDQTCRFAALEQRVDVLERAATGSQAAPGAPHPRA
ncbi:hypothetical protein [Novosphingobium sp. SG720]|uniref:hypothetical protein n=1 Tax=Novosphingobium sp. SG720 TaxID=2586998 RepID=UPI001444AF26|nr:hypothetical protein [Novosphingobium sp. SG720]NKJ40655.1 hypothetical protein [Novosphingobium sp. SG720]